jgi:hypothetical protein
VTRGQVAVFMGAGLNYLRRTSNSGRIGARQNLNVFNGVYENFKTANTMSAIGFCHDGFFAYISSQGSNKIDAYQIGAGNGTVGSYTLSGGSNRLACNATYIYAASDYGNTIARINKHTSVVEDPWVTLPVSGAGDIALAGQTLAVTTNTGIVIVRVRDGNICGNCNVALNGGTVTNSVAVDQNGYFWAATNNKLIRVDQGGTVSTTVTLSGTCSYYSVSDGANIWVPVSNGYDIVSAGGVLVEHKPFAFASDFATGGMFDGRNVFFSETGDLGCGAGQGDVIVAFDAGSHSFVQYIGLFCGERVVYAMGFDGMYYHVVSYIGDNHYIF